MLAPALPDDEQSRLEKLRMRRLLYSPMEERYDTITRAAKKDFNVPIALISLVGEDVQWFKSARGLCAAETPRRFSFCGHAIHQHDLFIVEDATKDQRFFDNPLVTGPPNVCFYAGAPLELGDGSGLGALVLIDHKPRTLNENEQVLLRALGKAAAAELAKSMRNPLEYRFLDELGTEEKCAAALDPMTRTWSAVALEQLFDRAKAPTSEAEPIAVLCLGLANYGQLQSSLEPSQLDEVVLELSARIRQWLGDLDFFGHVGSGEFVVVLREPRSIAVADLAAVIRDEVIGTLVKGDAFTAALEAQIGFVEMEDVPDFGFPQIWGEATLAKESAKSLDGTCKGRA